MARVGNRRNRWHIESSRFSGFVAQSRGRDVIGPDISIQQIAIDPGHQETLQVSLIGRAEKKERRCVHGP